MARRNPSEPQPLYVCHPPFDGWPYVLTRLTSGVYDIRLLPTHFDLAEQVSFIQAQREANRLLICLVHTGTKCAFFNHDGSVRVTTRPLEGGSSSPSGSHRAASFPRRPSSARDGSGSRPSRR
jgi:hypothetical protein